MPILSQGHAKQCNSVQAITAFTYHKIVNGQLEENEDILTSGFEANG